MVVFDGVARPHHARLFEPRNGRHQRELHVLRQRGRNAVRIDRGVVETFRLEENLMAVALAEADDLVLDRGAIARAAALDLPGIHRRAMHIGPDDRVRRLGGAGDAALDLRVLDPLGQHRERLRRLVAGLHLAGSPSRWCGRRAAAACRSSAARAQSRAAPASATGPWPAPRRPGRPAFAARRYGSGRAGTCRWSAPRRRQPKFAAIGQPDAGHRAVCRSQDRRPRLRSPSDRAFRGSRPAWPRHRACGRPGRAGPRTAGPLRRLSTRNWMPPWSATRPIRPSSASISRTRWPLPSPPMAGLQDIAPDGREPVGHQRGVRAHPRGRGRGLAAGVAAADHNDVEANPSEASNASAFSGARLFGSKWVFHVKSETACFT